MATIGTFKKTGAEFLGQIVTLNVQTKNVRIIPAANRTNGPGGSLVSHEEWAKTRGRKLPGRVAA